MSPCRKLRRLTRGGGDDAGNGETFPDWASLPPDLVELIGCQVLAGDLQDYVRFRAVCSHWSASTARPRGRGVLDRRFHPRRWMMLPEGHGLRPGHPDLHGFVRFFNLDTGAFARAHLPLLADHVILDVVDGLLLLHRNDDTAIRLLHPFTGDVAEFPPLASLLPQMELQPSYNNERTSLMRVRASVTVTSSMAITLVLALDRLHRVAYATAGDQHWTLSSWKLRHLLKPVSFQGKLYAFQRPSFDMATVYIYQYEHDPPCRDSDGDGQPRRVPLPVKIAECPNHRILDFVEWCSQLLLVSCNDVSCSKLLVYRLADLVSGKIEAVTDIGDHALFIGDRSLCVSLSPYEGSRTRSFPSISPNSIICMRTISDDPYYQRNDPYYRRNDPYYQWVVTRFEQYDLSTGIWTPASDGRVYQRPPIPHTLIHHIFTCCQNNFWNKGWLY